MHRMCMGKTVYGFSNDFHAYQPCHVNLAAPMVLLKLASRDRAIQPHLESEGKDNSVTKLRGNSYNIRVNI